MRRLLVSIRLAWRKVLSQPGSSQAIARGFAAGAFIAMTPTLGIQIVLAFFTAWAVRGNRVVALIPIWATNPVTMPPLLWFEYVLGSRIIYGREHPSASVIFEQVRLAIQDARGQGWFHSTMDAAGAILEMSWSVLGPLLLGSLIVSAVTGVVAYYVTVYAVEKLRARRKHRLRDLLRKLLKKETQPTSVERPPAEKASETPKPPSEEHSQPPPKAP